MDRRSFLIHTSSSLAAASLTGAAYAKYIEPFRLQARHYQCRLPRIGGTAVRLVHMADLHACPHVPNSLIESAFGKALEMKPDLICITGDFVTDRGGWNADWYRKALRTLTAKAPVYASMGNHDGGWPPSRLLDSRIVRGVLADAGVRVLHNEAAVVEHGGQSIELIGLADPWSGEFRARRAFAGVERKPLHPRVVLSHNPDTKAQLRPWPWDLMLSGHTHGGQVVIPGVGAPWAPVYDQRYLHGLKPWEGRQIHVTSGVGSARGVRLNCLPEVVLLELHGPRQQTS